MVDGNATGRPRSALDMIVAAIAEANDCVVVTDNEKDFAGLDIINPMRMVKRGGTEETETT
jgi:predicted nucleic acid-binding protein